MRILAIDTSTMFQAVALVEDGQAISDRSDFVERGHTSSLLSSVDACLRDASMGVRDLDLIAVGLGPGSFTGIRIGVSSAKALCYAIGRPIVGVSSLASIAWNRAVAETKLVVTAVDARKKEVYAAGWELRGSDPPHLVVPIEAYPPERLALVLASLERPIAGMGNGFALYREPFETALGDALELLPPHDGWPRAIAVAELGRRRFEAEGPDDLARLEPLYIRASDAELSWKRTKEVVRDETTGR